MRKLLHVLNELAVVALIIVGIVQLMRGHFNEGMVSWALAIGVRANNRIDAMKEEE